MNTTRNKEKGVALILALGLMLATTVLAVSLAYVARSGTFASMNYRLISQARDAAEAGVNVTAHHLMFEYAKPGDVSDPLTNYSLTTSPIQYSNGPVILSGKSGQSANYPNTAAQAAFNTAAHGSLNVAGTTVNYAATARLLAMRQVKEFAKSTNTTIQTWEINSDGTIAGIQNAQVQVSAILEQQAGPVFDYAAFATDPTCGALTFGGGGTTDSYDSSTVSGGTVTTQAYGGNVGTNGNLVTQGSVTVINGTLSTPRTGVGACSTSGVTAWTARGGTVTGGLVDLPATVVYPDPDLPNPMPDPTQDITFSPNGPMCPAGLGGGCTMGASNGNYRLTPGGCPPSGTPTTYGNITVQGNLHLTAGCYNINTLVENGTGIITVDSGPVILNFAGKEDDGTSNITGDVIKLTGGGVSNSTLDPMNLQMLYAGPGEVTLKGGALASAVLYAPNATYAFAGGGNWYGAVLGKRMTDMGGAAIHYDRRLKFEGEMVGGYTLGSFSWKKY